jgi:GT2 family glycosyltransferase
MSAVDNVAVVIAVHNRLELTQRCIAAIRTAGGGRRVTFVVVDDGSSDGSRAWLLQQPNVEVLSGDGNLWFGGATNLALQHILGVRDRFEYVLILNNDTFVEPGLFDILGEAARPGLVVAGAYWIDELSRIGSAGFVWRPWRGFGDVSTTTRWRESFASGGHVAVPVDAVATTVVLLPMAILGEVSFPSVYWHPHNRYDAILSARLRAAGAKFACVTRLIAHHCYGEASTRPSLRRLRLRKFINETFVDRKSVWHFGGRILQAWETAPTVVARIWGVLHTSFTLLRCLAIAVARETLHSNR